MIRNFILGLAILLGGALQAQEGYGTAAPADSARGIGFTTREAWLFIDRAIGQDELWREGADSVRNALRRLLLHVSEPFDSIREDLAARDFASIPVRTGIPRVTDSVRIRWINDSTFIVDPQGWSNELYMKTVPELVYPVDLKTLSLSDSILDERGMLDSALFTPDTIYRSVLDTAALRSLDIGLYHYRETEQGLPVIHPPLARSDSNRLARLSADKAYVEYMIPGTRWEAEPSSPFHLLDNNLQLDSLQHAVTRLLDFALERDSSRLLISDVSGRSTPYWITSGSDELYRLWVKNYNNDSVTIWLGNPGPGELSLLLEDEVNFNRLDRAYISYLPRFRKEPEATLMETAALEPIPIYWDYEFHSSVAVSQTYFSNWTKGGESSFATVMDLMGKAIYNNKEASTRWTSMARLKFGTISTPDKGFRKNHDEFSLDSKFNQNAWSKIGLSASFYMKNQIARGYNYPNDSVVVSKFLNPGTMTIGIGAEYKPFEKTTLNLAPLSYKTTFVFDTARIDQTIHGIASDQRARQEFGVQLVVESEFSPLEDLKVTNRARFFSNYLNHPQNIDVDWELNVSQKIAWFFTVSLNLHLIYDDDVRFTVFGEDDNPVMNPDGSEKKVPKLQFKEFLGLTLTVDL